MVLIDNECDFRYNGLRALMIPGNSQKKLIDAGIRKLEKNIREYFGQEVVAIYRYHESDKGIFLDSDFRYGTPCDIDSTSGSKFIAFEDNKGYVCLDGLFDMVPLSSLQKTGEKLRLFHFNNGHDWGQITQYDPVNAYIRAISNYNNTKIEYNVPLSLIGIRDIVANMHFPGRNDCDCGFDED